MIFELFAKAFGYTYAHLVLVYYRIRHPFSWREKFNAAHGGPKHKAPTKIALTRIGGDFTMSDATSLNNVMWSFSFGNSIVGNSKGEYISVKPTKGKEV
jgi:hypothetical protein